MTPVFAIQADWVGKKIILWLTCQEKVNDKSAMRSNNCFTRLCAKGSWGALKMAEIQDLQPFRVDDIIGWKGEGHWDWTGIAQSFKAIDAILERGDSHALFCKRGARRSAVMVGTYLMMKTRCDADTMYRHLESVRKCVEPKIVNDLKGFQEWTTGMAQERLTKWCDLKKRPLQAVLSGDEFLQVLTGARSLEKKNVPGTGFAQWMVCEKRIEHGFLDPTFFFSAAAAEKVVKLRSRSTTSLSKNPTSKWGVPSPFPSPPATTAKREPADSFVEDSRSSKTQKIDAGQDATGFAQKDDAKSKAYGAAYPRDPSPVGGPRPPLEPPPGASSSIGGPRPPLEPPPGASSSSGEWNWKQWEQRVQQLESLVYQTPMERQAEYTIMEALANGDPNKALRLLEDGHSPVFYDVGNLTPMHRAARGAYVAVINQLLMHDPEAANVRTNRQRNPGWWTPMMCLADADKTLLATTDCVQATEILIQSMDLDHIMTQSQKNNKNVFHMVAHNNKKEVLEMMCSETARLHGERKLKDILNTHDHNGRGVWDVCKAGTAECRNIVEKWGGTQQLWDKDRLTKASATLRSTAR